MKTQILNWSDSCEVEMPGFGGESGPIAIQRIMVWQDQFPQFSSGSKPNLEPLLTLDLNIHSNLSE
jgi:hypothetical protein